MKSVFIMPGNYLSLIENSNEDDEKPIHRRDITGELIWELFCKSNMKCMAFKSKEDAELCMKLSLVKHGMSRKHLNGSFPYLAVPVIVEAVVNENDYPEINQPVNVDILTNFLNLDTISGCPPEYACTKIKRNCSALRNSPMPLFGWLNNEKIKKEHLKNVFYEDSANSEEQSGCCPFFRFFSRRQPARASIQAPAESYSLS